MRTRALVAIVATAAVLAPTGGIAHADHRPNHGPCADHGNKRPVYIREDGFLNYDFRNQRGFRCDVDWPVALIFWDAATINRVKDALRSKYDRGGTYASPQNAFLSEHRTSLGWRWDVDQGQKETICPGGPGQPPFSVHYRIYAPPDDSLFNLEWGYWVFGTTHRDIQECPGGVPSTFGRSELAEDQLVSDWRELTDWGAINDWFWLGNREDFRVEGDHIWQNNGSASAFRVRPADPTASVR